MGYGKDPYLSYLAPYKDVDDQSLSWNRLPQFCV